MLPTITEEAATRRECPILPTEFDWDSDGEEHFKIPRRPKCIGRKCAAWRFVHAEQLTGNIVFDPGDGLLGMEHEGVCLALPLVLNVNVIQNAPRGGALVRP